MVESSVSTRDFTWPKWRILIKCGGREADMEQQMVGQELQHEFESEVNILGNVHHHQAAVHSLLLLKKEQMPFSSRIVSFPSNTACLRKKKENTACFSSFVNMQS
jgi:hypothetical protein